MFLPSFLYTITPFQWFLLGLLLVVFAVQLYFYLHYYSAVLQWKKKIKRNEVSFIADQPPVSVIICAKNESENLQKFLPKVLEQNYPNFEVIVVNDGSTDESEDLLVEMAHCYPQLYHTYVPSESKVISSKKLALTVGIKAAKNDLLLFTDADCYPSSKEWISNMVRNFTTQTDFVLGYGAYEKKKGLISHLISFDTFFIALQYMGFAIKGRPYMGVGRNMAYRREVFFKMKGFASFLHLQSGDDDLFVNKAATHYNTRAEVSPESVTLSPPNTTFRSWFIQKERHLSTAALYTSQSKWLIGWEVLTRGIFYAVIVGLCCFVQVPLLIIAGVFFLLRLMVQLLVVNLSAKQFGERKFFTSLVVFDIFLPLVNLYIFTINRLFHRGKGYRWK
jgi:glycosyltransferase involved in cell wall biosynthesis